MQFGLARFNPDGTPDTSFGDGGLVLGPVNAPASGVASAIALQPDGDAVVAGAAAGNGGTRWCVARFKPDGTPDASFGIDGVVYTSFDDPVNYPQGIGTGATGVSILPDGKILVFGSGGAGTALARYNPDGSLDTTFGTAGKVSLAVPGYLFVVQADGKIVLVGGSGEIDITRLNADGSLDTQFGDGGFVTTPFPDGMGGWPGTIALQSDGKILVGGADGDNYFVARFNADGTLDSSFGGSGWITAPFVAGNEDEVTSIAIQPNGQIVVAGDSFDIGSWPFQVIDNIALAGTTPTVQSTRRSEPVAVQSLSRHHSTPITATEACSSSPMAAWSWRRGAHFKHWS